MSPSMPATTANTSALVQHFLLYHGARYVSRASEDNWKRVPVTLQVPAPSADDMAAPRVQSPPLLPGTWLVLPWDAPSYEQVEAWLQQLADARMMPTVFVLVLLTPVLREAPLMQLSRQYGVRIVAVSAIDAMAYGDPTTAAAVQTLFHPQQRQALNNINPLDHLAALGDPRNPDVFFERLQRTGRGSPVTIALIALNVVVFVAMMAMRPDAISGFLGEFGREQLAATGANIAALTVGANEAWRLLTCTFMHANLLHIGMNMWVLKSVGDTAERLFGSAMFGVLYLLAGLGGSIASLGWTLADSPQLPSLGASGAVFGMIGGLLGFALSRRGSVPAQVFRGLTRSALMFTVVTVAFGLSFPMIDNAAHIGGLVVGFASGVVLSRDLPPAPQPSRIRRAAAVSACLVVLGIAFQFASSLVRM